MCLTRCSLRFRFRLHRIASETNCTCHLTNTNNVVWRDNNCRVIVGVNSPINTICHTLACGPTRNATTRRSWRNATERIVCNAHFFITTSRHLAGHLCLVDAKIMFASVVHCTHNTQDTTLLIAFGFFLSHLVIKSFIQIVDGRTKDVQSRRTLRNVRSARERMRRSIHTRAHVHIRAARSHKNYDFHWFALFSDCVNRKPPKPTWTHTCEHAHTHSITFENSRTAKLWRRLHADDVQ